mgnify:CR=1 FL=1
MGLLDAFVALLNCSGAVLLVDLDDLDLFRLFKVSIWMMISFRRDRSENSKIPRTLVCYSVAW